MTDKRNPRPAATGSRAENGTRDPKSTSGGVFGLIVAHDPWCPMGYGEGSACATGCTPTMRIVDEAELIERMTLAVRNRAQRRADLKRGAP